MMASGEWGEFFPAALSPFSYPDTVAYEHQPLDKQEALRQGFNWFDFPVSPPHASEIIPAKELPDSIEEVTDAILNCAVRCESSGRAFRIVAPELAFYRQNGVPLPRQHPDVRHKARMGAVNPRALWTRECVQCRTAVESPYATNRKERVLCEPCYLKAVY